MVAYSNDVDVTLLEERSFTFDCIVRTLQSLLPDEENPLCLLAMAFLFHSLDANGYADLALSKVENQLHALPDVRDSGMQVRDCLVAAGYLYVAKETKRDTVSVDHIALQRIRFAAENEWLKDSQLAAIIALISEQVQVGPKAIQYLRENVDVWLRGNHTLELLHYSLVEDGPDCARVRDYLLSRDWAGDDVNLLAWELLVLGRLQRSGYKVHDTQAALAQRLMVTLNQSELVISVVRGRPDIRSIGRGKLTYFDYAFAACALHNEGFDGIIGVSRSQKKSLEALLNLQQILVRGGRVVPRNWQFIYELSFFGFLTLSLWELLGITGIEVLYSTLARVISSALIVGGGWLIFRKRSPTEAAMRSIFGNAVPSESSPRKGGSDDD